MRAGAKVYVAGHQGLVGSALMRRLSKESCRLVTRTFQELDLRCQAAVEQFFKTEQPEYVFLAAAKVGGIWANSQYPADFLYDNLMIAANVMYAAYKFGVTKLLFLGSSCIYPRDCAQPIKESSLLTGPLEPTNEAYALAKIAGLKLCQAYRKQYGANFIASMPTNLYGPYDTFDIENSHVIPALITKFCAARDENLPVVTLWGTGQPLREFLFVDDCADALVFLMKHYHAENPINIGSGQECSISDLAHAIKTIIEFSGSIFWDHSKPDGTPRKIVDIHTITQLGWRAKTGLYEGLQKTIAWYEHQKNLNIGNIYKQSTCLVGEKIP